ncbi:hypothetical protein WJX73_002617 [Symbiochloris irregularis]|uniref:Uncharacterized protein n=1 Tax=Symbiochloris irregularis TaxID=706552 RepID=A0AAW1PPN3_9CHLO
MRQVVPQGAKRLHQLAPTQRAPRQLDSQREEQLVEFFDAPVAPGDPPAKTALSAEPRYSRELFDRWPAPAGLSKPFVREVQDSLCGARMNTGSPTMEQLRAWNYDCYEHFVILDAYASP